MTTPAFSADQWLEFAHAVCRRDHRKVVDWLNLNAPKDSAGEAQAVLSLAIGIGMHARSIRDHEHRDCIHAGGFFGFIPQPHWPPFAVRCGQMVAAASNEDYQPLYAHVDAHMAETDNEQRQRTVGELCEALALLSGLYSRIMERTSGQ